MYRSNSQIYTERIHTTDKYTIVDGKKVKTVRYTCYGKYAKRVNCQGQTGYSTKRLDSLVDGAIRFIIERMKNIPKSEVVASSLLALKQEQETRYRAAQRDYTNKAAELADLKGEVIKAIRGESKFTSDLLGELITQSEKSLAEIGVDRDAIKRKLDECENRIEEMQIRYDEVISWTDLYDTVDLSARK